MDRTHVWPDPTATFATPLATGVFVNALAVVLPVPRCEELFAPQQIADPPLVVAQKTSAPLSESIEVTPEIVVVEFDRTEVGVATVDVPPFPV
jgi:hypothetical protein